MPEETPDYGRKPAILAFLVWGLARLIGMTLRIRYEHFERIAEATAGGKGAILVAWHGRSLIPANILRHRGYWALISLSRDGEIQNHIFRRFGFQTLRGSTGRGGARATIALLKKLNEGGVLAFTPDGPRGPTHKVQPGTIFFAMRTGCPIIPMGASARPRKLLRSWDSYMIPKPFARAAFVLGEPLTFPPNMDEAEQQAAAEAVEAALNAVERRAEELMGFPPTM